jgi:hypothetical protein
MARLFAALRRQLDLFQRHNHHGQFGAACGAAAAAAGEAAASGLFRLAAAATEAAAKAGRGEFLRSDAVEQLDILLDSAEALWSTGRCRLWQSDILGNHLNKILAIELKRWIVEENGRFWFISLHSLFAESRLGMTQKRAP